MRHVQRIALMAGVLGAFMPAGAHGPGPHGEGYPASPDERQRRRDAKAARIYLIERADEKRKRKAAKRRATSPISTKDGGR